MEALHHTYFCLFDDNKTLYIICIKNKHHIFFEKSVDKMVKSPYNMPINNVK